MVQQDRFSKQGNVGRLPLSLTEGHELCQLFGVLFCSI